METTATPSYRRYWMALYRRDVDEAQRVVEVWLARWPPQRLYLRLFEPALNLSGTLFAKGTIGFQDEHFVTFHTLRFLRQVRRRWIPSQTDGPLALATGVGQESHLIGLRMVCDFLQGDNWRIHWLASNDRAAVRACVERLRPRALLLSVGLERSVGEAGRLIDAVRGATFPGVIAIGGRAINLDSSLVSTLGADVTAHNGLELSRQFRKLFREKHEGHPTAG